MHYPLVSHLLQEGERLVDVLRLPARGGISAGGDSVPEGLLLSLRPRQVHQVEFGSADVLAADAKEWIDWGDSVNGLEWQCEWIGVIVWMDWSDSVNGLEWQCEWIGVTVWMDWSDSV